MPQNKEKPSASSMTSKGGTFLLTPEQHRNQASMLRLSKDPENLRRADVHDRLAAAIEARGTKAAAAS